jgi:hypothetical protein
MTDRNELTRAPLRPELQETVNKVRALRDLTRSTGFQTSRSVGQLLGRLSADDLAIVAQALDQQ